MYTSVTILPKEGDSCRPCTCLSPAELSRLPSPRGAAAPGIIPRHCRPTHDPAARLAAFNLVTRLAPQVAPLLHREIAMPALLDLQKREYIKQRKRYQAQRNA